MNKTRIQTIENLLSDKLSPLTLEVIDDSAQHIGHAGASSGAGHYTVKIKCDAFDGKSLIECHRLVYAALDNLIPNEIHALVIKVIR